MSKPAFLVEGQMEQKIIQAICPGIVVRRINCNGIDVSMRAIAKTLDANMRLLKNYYPIFIVFDREGREQSCEKLMAELSEILNAKDYAGTYRIGIADRTIENWILADWRHALELFDGDDEDSTNHDGENGKSRLKKMLPKGIVYNETTIGVDLFRKCRPSEMYANSSSFRKFVDTIDIKCWWLKSVQKSPELI